MKIPILTLSILCALGVAGPFAQDVPEKHVVMIVWDGMRPDYVNEKETPVLWNLAKQGVTFRNHHPVYPSATNVNGTALVTGMYPGHSGILANHEYRPEIDRKKAIDVESPEVVQKGDEMSGGKYVACPTIPEIVRGSGRESVVATAKTVGLLQDRHPDVPRGKNSALVSSGQTMPPDALVALASQLGAFPKSFVQKDAWTTRVLTEIFWKNGVPAFSLLWLSEPDGAEHETAPGSEAARAALKSCDDNLAAVLATLDRKGARPATDVFVVSDHGFSTIERSIDPRKILQEAGFNVATEFANDPKPGDIMMAGNGGTVFFYVMQHDAGVTRRLVELLQQSDFAGVILTREKMDGTFQLEQAGISNEHAPDVAMAFRWNEKKNQFGIPGMIDADWQRAAGKGTHATLGRFDMHNTLIASGPDFRAGQTEEIPSGNVDLAPTILHILGITPPQPMDGRVLAEVMENVDRRKLGAETKTIEAKRDFASGAWRQTLKVSNVGSTIYFDEGNGAFTPQK